MTGGGPLPVREFASVAEMRASYAAVRQRLLTVAPVVAKPAPPVRAVAPAEPDRYREVRASPYPYEGFRVPTARQVAGTARVSADEMVALTVDATGFGRKHLCGQSRTASLVKARQIGMWLVHRHAGLSHVETARRFGDRHHTTAMHAVRRVDGVFAALHLSADASARAVACALWASDWPAADVAEAQVSR